MFISTRLLRPNRSAFTFLHAFALIQFFVSSGSFVFGQAPTKLWDKTIGGNGYEDEVKVMTTSDGGYILGGSSASNASGQKSENSKGGTDYWIVKLSSSGVKQWDKTIGGNSADYLYDIWQTTDGGYVLAGYSASNASGDKSENVSGGGDAWIVKLSAAGSIQWENTLGGDNGDGAYNILQTTDGGYIFSGYSASGISGDKSEVTRGNADFWVVKLNSDGGKAWDHVYGGNDFESNGYISATADGGYILGGTSVSGVSGDKTQASFGMTDYWVVKLSSSGTKEWDRTFGGDNSDTFGAIVQTSTGEYLVSGESSSGVSGNKSADFVLSPANDFWIVKLDASGDKVWDKTYGGALFNRFSSLALTFEGGFVFGGWSLSNAPAGPFDYDYTIIKASADGLNQWKKSFGGPDEDRLYSVHPTPDRGYIVAGNSYSGVGPDKSESNAGDRDFWIIRLAGDPLPVTLAAFSAIKEGNTALLHWKTTSETSSSEFEIQHSLDGKQWNAISSVAAAGESSIENTYRFVHTEPVSGPNNLYRLKMIDIDGSFALSSIKSLVFGQENAGRIYPNPTMTGQLTVDVKNWESVQKVQISTISALMVYDSGNNPQPTIDTQNLPAGIYILKVFKKDGTFEQHRFVR